MTMREDQRWICSNPNCRREVYVMFAAASGGGALPKCSCGSPMKKPYTPPSLTQARPSEGKEVYGERLFSRVP